MEDNKFKNAEENSTLIILGVLGFYFLVVFFIAYMFLLHRFSVLTTVLSLFIFSGIYFPRFWIIKKILKKDIIKILDNSIIINGQNVEFAQVLDYRVEKKKSKVVFYISSKMVVFNEAVFYLKLQNKTVAFTAIGSEKISLLKSFFDELLGK